MGTFARWRLAGMLAALNVAGWVFIGVTLTVRG